MGCYSQVVKLVIIIMPKKFKEHYKKQKFIFKLAKSINKMERILPILSICHGFQNSMLIESKESINNLFTNVYAYYAYKTNPEFTKEERNLENCIINQRS